jgi:hypothetical protein
MQTKILLSVAILLAVLFAAGAAVAKNGKGNNGTSVQLQTDLDPCCGNPEPQANGEADRRVTNKDNRFQAEVNIPIPNAVGVTAGNARATDVRLILSRGGTDYAECRLVFDEVNQDKKTGEAEAEYKLDLRNKKSRGSCSPGVPDIQAGDVGTATLVTNPSDRTLDIDLLQGIFCASDD